MKNIIWISLVFLIFGGVRALSSLWSGVAEVLIAFFPFFAEVGKMALENYLTSPYFIVSVIMAIASGFGIWFGRKGGKILFLIVSIICEVLSLVSIFANVM